MLINIVAIAGVGPNSTLSVGVTRGKSLQDQCFSAQLSATQKDSKPRTTQSQPSSTTTHIPTVRGGQLARSASGCNQDRFSAPLPPIKKKAFLSSLRRSTKGRHSEQSGVQRTHSDTNKRPGSSAIARSVSQVGVSQLLGLPVAASPSAVISNDLVTKLYVGTTSTESCDRPSQQERCDSSEKGKSISLPRPDDTVLNIQSPSSSSSGCGTMPVSSASDEPISDSQSSSSGASSSHLPSSD